MSGLWNQKSTEGVEDYAVELKRLYDKGNATRPLVIRQDDLLRRYQYGLADRKVAQQVEFVKEPKTIDEAVVEVVPYMESSRRVKGSDGYADKKASTWLGQLTLLIWILTQMSVVKGWRGYHKIQKSQQSQHKLTLRQISTCFSY